MKLLYLDCQMGAAGDMLTAALLELFPNPAEIISNLNSFGIPNVYYEAIPTKKCGISGTRVSVKILGEEESCEPDSHHSHYHSHHHSHTGLHEIEHLVEDFNISAKVKQDVLQVYRLIADAESMVHGVPVSQIHFHEVGNLDAIADITAVCYLLDLLSPNCVITSPIHVGSGQVHCAHGILPVPAPATLRLLQGCPIYSKNIVGELCTPTGAALLKYFTNSFGSMPDMSVSAIGYGMGKKDFEAANCVRALLGNSSEQSEDGIWELSCHVDDMTAEQIGYALEIFFKEGALDAFTIPVMMKKNRPGTLIQILCNEEQKDSMISSIFRHTSTAGIRKNFISRSILQRQITELETPFGIIRRKDYSGYNIRRSKYEYDDLAAAASKHGLSIAELLEILNG